jgi:hypothetical protein
MKLALANLASSGGTMVAVLGGATAAALGSWGVYRYIKGRPSAAELERRRRIALHSRGKMGDANLLEFREHVAFYTYDIAGVEYSACQDLAGLEPLLPADRWSTIGPACIKYDPRNPANSIVLCEQWSGLRTANRVKSD